MSVHSVWAAPIPTSFLKKRRNAQPSQTLQSPKLLVFSAPTPSALNNMVSNFREHLRVTPTINLADAAFTLQTGRRAFDWRHAFVCEDRDEALRLLDPAMRPAPLAASQVDPKIVFMFTGQGSQYPGMGADLYRKEPLFKSVVDECLELARPHVEMDLREILWPESDQENSPLSITPPSLNHYYSSSNMRWRGFG